MILANIKWIFFDIGSTLVDESVAYQNRIERTITGTNVTYDDFYNKMVAPTNHYQALYPHVPEELKSKVHFIPSNCKDIWEWSEKVYEYVKQKNGK